MSVVIRMKRAGARKRPFFRVVVADSRSPRDGRYIEQLGYYDPLTNPATFQIDAAKFSIWIQRGALPSESVGVMVAKHAPEALRRMPAAVPQPVEEHPAEPIAKPKPKPKRGKAAKAKPTKAKSERKAKASTRGSEKKAKTRAKIKARKASGAAPKPRAAKKKKTKK